MTALWYIIEMIFVIIGSIIGHLLYKWYMRQ